MSNLIRALGLGFHREPVPLHPASTQVTDPALWYRIFGNADSYNQYQRYVTEHSVCGLPAVNAAVNIVSYSCGQMMTAAKAYDGKGNSYRPEVVALPNVLFNPTAYWQMVFRTVLMHGNFVGIIVGDQVVPVHPGAVVLDDTSGYPIYQIGNSRFDRNDIVHIAKDAPVGGYWGMGIIASYRYALEGHLAEQNYGITSYTSAGVPSAVIGLDAEEVTEAQMTAVRQQWTERTKDGRSPVVLPRHISVTPLSWSPKDAQYADAQRFTVAEAAYMAGLVPSDLEASVGGNSSLTYANLTDRQLARVAQSYAPILALVEEEWSRLTPGLNVKGTVEALLRSSTKERYELELLRRELGITEEAGPLTNEDLSQ